MPLYIGDYLSDTMHLTTEQHGAYLLLLMAAWKNGGNLPVSENKLAIIAKVPLEKWREISGEILEYFETDGDRITQRRLSDELAKASRHFESRKINGKNGGRPKGTTSALNHDWLEMLEYFNYSCLSCGYEFPEGNRPTKDHIIPQTKGGPHEIWNLQPLCRNCNASKNDKHSTDYRLKHMDQMPEHLQAKWFKDEQKKPGKNLPVTTKKPNNNRQETPLPSPSQEEIQEAPPLVPPHEKPKRRPSKRCPADFAITAEMRAWAASETPGLDLDRETAKMRDHEFATARKDWPAVWRNWLRTAAERGTGGKHAKRPESFHEYRKRLYPDAGPDLDGTGDRSTGNDLRPPLDGTLEFNEP